MADAEFLTQGEVFCYLMYIQAGSELKMPRGRKSPENSFPDDRSGARVAAMTINPYLVHVWWQISGQHLEAVQAVLGGPPTDARPALRFYDITCILFDGTNAHQTFDVEVDLRTRKWNVSLWSADKSYVIDLGYKASDGRFHQIARSNIVNLPRSGPSLRRAEHYLRVEEGQIKGPAPVPTGRVPRGMPVGASRPETLDGPGKDPGPPFKQDARHVEAADAAQVKQGSKGGALKPCHGPKAVVNPLDLVDLTEERFSSCVSSSTFPRETGP